MARFFLFGLIALPLVEIALFIKVGQLIGVFPTLALIVGGVLLGSFLLRLQGLSVLGQLRSNVNSGRLPARTLADTMMIGVAAILLIVPGFLSDAMALLLLLPFVRGWIYSALASRVTVVNAGTASYRQETREPGQIPGTIDLDDDDYRQR